jgi:AmmeMemoRadiSam system protein B
MKLQTVLAAMPIPAACCVVLLGFGCSERADLPLVRTPVDSVGYATVPAQLEAVIAFADSAERDRFAAADCAPGIQDGGRMVGAIFPHDDYLYAGQVYYHVVRRIDVPLLVLIGVSHSARRRDIQDKLIFDDFDAWNGPYGPVPVAPFRDAVISALPKDMVLVSNEVHAEEHSLEAIIPFLQFPYHADGGYGDGRPPGDGPVILPILVTRFRGRSFEAAADTLAAVLHEVFAARDLRLGRDVALLVSADCVHYGDDAWGGRNYAPFGVDSAGYVEGMRQDRDIIRASLTGPLSAAGIDLFRRTVERDDFQWPYKVTWCGVYSIPFGLRVLLSLSELSGRPVPEGALLRYGTSLDTDMRAADGGGLGVTNISTLRHWVGYAAIGYW